MGGSTDSGLGPPGIEASCPGLGGAPHAPPAACPCCPNGDNCMRPMGPGGGSCEEGGAAAAAAGGCADDCDGWGREEGSSPPKPDDPRLCWEASLGGAMAAAPAPGGRWVDSDGKESRAGGAAPKAASEPVPRERAELAAEGGAGAGPPAMLAAPKLSARAWVVGMVGRRGRRRRTN